MENRLHSLCEKFVRYRLNTYFISSCLSHGHIPVGFRIKTLPPVPDTTDSRSGLKSIWKSALTEASVKLMKATCGFYATELPAIASDAQSLQSSVSPASVLGLVKVLHRFHMSICKRHIKKLHKFGFDFSPLAFACPLRLDISFEGPNLSPNAAPFPDRTPIGEPRRRQHIVDNRGRRFQRRTQNVPVSGCHSSDPCDVLISDPVLTPSPVSSCSIETPTTDLVLPLPVLVFPIPETPVLPARNTDPAFRTPENPMLPAPSPSPNSDEYDFTDDEVREELARRGYHGVDEERFRAFKEDLRHLLRYGSVPECGRPSSSPPPPDPIPAPTTPVSTHTASTTSTIDLTGRSLPSTFLSVLDKGKGFCPNPGPYNNFALVQDTMEFTRRCRLAEYFDGRLPRTSDIPKKLYVKSTWQPPSGRSAALDLYCERMELDAASFIPDNNPIRDNLSREERQALRSMSADSSLTIRQADKGRRMVIMDTEDYDGAISAILSNTEIYAPLRQDPTPDIKSLIQTQVGVLNDCGIISDELHRCINWGDVECPHFYGLPKVHKTIPPGSKLPPMRGIISSVKGPTTRASYYLDSVLNPLVPAYCGDHWCKDTTHILQEIDTLNRNTVSYSSETHTLVAIDVVDMYNSIPHDEGIEACRDALVSLSSYSLPQIKEILILLNLVLSNNCFFFKGNFYRQIRGTAMGTPCAPAYANIFMAFLWKTRIVPGLPTQPEWLKRFLDDFLGIFPAIFCLHSLLSFLNSVHDTVKFTASMGLPSTEPESQDRDSDTAFLDLSVHFSEGKIHTDLYSKPTDSHTYLSPRSCHPKHIFRSIVYSGALRLRRICSKDVYFCKRLSEFAKHLVASGYSEPFIHGIFPKIAAKERATLLVPKPALPIPATCPPATSSNPSPGQEKRGLTFVTTFHPRMHNVNQSHNTNFIHLQASARMKKLLPHRPLVAMRRTANLGNRVIHTKPRDAPVLDNSPGFHACSSSRCHIHSRFAILGPTVKSSKTGVSFPIREHITCSSSRVIYVLTCRRCGSQYTGKTITPLRSRFNNERSAIRNHHSMDPEVRRPYGYHFNLPDHDGENDLQVQGIEVVPGGTSILQRESFWQWQLKTHQLTGGMNIAEEHFTGLTLCN